MAPEISISGKKISKSDLPITMPGLNVNSQYYCCEIKDNGIGFEQKDADRIFNVFTRLHADVQYRGTGIGLSIVKKAAENHNGFIRAESVPGVGSTFKIYMPLES